MAQVVSLFVPAHARLAIDSVYHTPLGAPRLRRLLRSRDGRLQDERALVGAIPARPDVL